MTFAVRNIGWVSGKRWEFVAISAVQTAAGNLSLPATVLAGDVVIISGSDSVVGSTPSGYTRINAAASRHYYRICTGGETSAGRPTASGRYYTAIFRPIDGVAAFHSTAIDGASVDRTMTLPNDQTCLVLAIGEQSGSSPFTWNAPLLPAPSSVHGEFSVTSYAAQVASATPPRGTTSTGAMRLSNSAGALLAQIFAVFTI